MPQEAGLITIKVKNPRTNVRIFLMINRSNVRALCLIFEFHFLILNIVNVFRAKRSNMETSVPIYTIIFLLVSN